MIDSTIVRAHACSAGLFQEREALERSNGGFATKIHALTDALGNPLRFILTLGQVSDLSQARELTIEIFNVPCLADKGYDADHLEKTLEIRGCTAVIPPRKTEKILEYMTKNFTKNEI